MKNSNKTQIFCNQFQMFQDKNFNSIPKVKLIKVEQNEIYQENEDQSSCEDIFQQMGNNNIDNDKQKKKQKNQQIDQITNKNSDWNSFYSQRLKQLRLEKNELNHNQITQIISEEWKQIKKHQTQKISNIDDDFLSVNRKKQKQQKLNQKQVQKYYEEILESESEIDFNFPESVQFIENLRNNSFKIVVNDQIITLPGRAIIEAIQLNSEVIYLNDNNNQQNTKVHSPNEKLQTNQEVIGSDSEQSIYKGNEEIFLENKLRSFL